MRAAADRPALWLVAALGCGEPEPPPIAPPAAASAEPTTPAPRAPLSVAAVAVGGQASFARMNDGSVRAWGDGAHAELGGEVLQASTPVVVPGVSDATAIAAGGKTEGTACILRADGTVQCWGGAGASPVPVAVPPRGLPPTTIDALAGARAIAIGDAYGCAILANDELRCWGAVPGWPAVDAGAHRGPTLVPDLRARIVRAGHDTVCVVTTANAAVCWGSNDSSKITGRLTSLAPIARPTAVDLPGAALDVSLSGKFLCVLDEARAVRCRGEMSTSHGQAEFPGAPIAASAKAFAAGTYARQFCQISERRQTACRGQQFCLVGDDDRVACLDDRFEVRPLARLPPVAALAAGGEHQCALARDGEVWCWGENSYGQLGTGAIGQGATSDSPEPAPVLHVAADPLPAQPPPPAPPAAQDFTGLPDGCVHQPLTLITRFTGTTSFTVQMAHAKHLTDKLEIYLRDHTLAKFEPIWLADPGPRQLGITLELTKPSVTYRRLPMTDPFDPEPAYDRKEKRLAVTPGVYRTSRWWLWLDDDAPKVRPTAEVVVRSDRDVQTIDARKDDPTANQQIELTHLGPDWVCGKISLVDDRGALAGRFAAKLIP